MKYTLKLISLLALILLSNTTFAQNRYYIIDSSDVLTSLPFMEAALNSTNVEPRYSLDSTLAILKFNPNNLPPVNVGIGYSKEEILTIVQTDTWQDNTPIPIEIEERIDLARAKGREITNAWFSFIDRKQPSPYGDGTWTWGQCANAYLNYKDMFGLISEGLFSIVVRFIETGSIAPIDVITQPMLNNLKDTLIDWENNHPR